MDGVGANGGEGRCGANVRIPIGDWMFRPYDVYDEVEDGVRCNDGAIEELDRALALCRKYGLQVLLDMHAWIGSQNGLDNSGETKFVKWASKFDSGSSGESGLLHVACSICTRTLTRMHTSADACLVDAYSRSVCPEGHL